MLTAQYNFVSQIFPLNEDSHQQAKHFAQLQELDLNSLHTQKQINNEYIGANKEYFENINYLLALGLYTVGLFAIAYWMLSSHHLWSLILGLVTVLVGIKLFFKPLIRQHQSTLAIDEPGFDSDSFFLTDHR
jgi:hypothetical protein